MDTMKFEEILERDGVLTYTNVGVSMLPLLHENRDVMIIRKRPHGSYRKYDAVLFRRPNVSGRGEYVLHRILRDNGNGTFWIVGDNCIGGETVREENILGVLTGIVRNGKENTLDSTAYRLYVKLWCAPFRFRFAVLRGKHFLRRCFSFGKRCVKAILVFFGIMKPLN